MRFIYDVTYEQKFGGEWYEYTDTVVGGVDGFSAIEKVKKKALDEAMGELGCTGFRLISLTRDKRSIDY